MSAGGHRLKIQLLAPGVMLVKHHSIWQHVEEPPYISVQAASISTLPLRSMFGIAVRAAEFQVKVLVTPRMSYRVLSHAVRTYEDYTYQLIILLHLNNYLAFVVSSFSSGVAVLGECRTLNEEFDVDVANTLLQVLYQRDAIAVCVWS